MRDRAGPEPAPDQGDIDLPHRPRRCQCNPPGAALQAGTGWMSAPPSGRREEDKQCPLVLPTLQPRDLPIQLHIPGAFRTKTLRFLPDRPWIREAPNS